VQNYHYTIKLPDGCRSSYYIRRDHNRNHGASARPCWGQGWKQGFRGSNDCNRDGFSHVQAANRGESCSCVSILAMMCKRCWNIMFDSELQVHVCEHLALAAQVRFFLLYSLAVPRGARVCAWQADGQQEQCSRHLPTSEGPCWAR
jgi:hypothetical protein